MAIVALACGRWQASGSIYEGKALDHPGVERFIEDTWEGRIVPALVDYIRIPNQSAAFDPQWEAGGHMERAAALLAAWARSFQPDGAKVWVERLPGRAPTLLVDVPGKAPGNVLLYGHYDKQPPFTGWAEGLGPWQPVRRDERLYGRGGADDGYALFASLAAIAAVQRQGLPHARCLVLIEGNEESGSEDLPFYIEALADRIGEPDLVVCLDAECGDYDRLWLTTSLRGMLPGTLTVDVLREGVHSGAAGGIVPSSFRVLRHLIGRVEDAGTGAIEPLQAPIPEAARAQAKALAAVLGDAVVERFPWAAASRPPPASHAALALANAWAPSLAVVGLSGAPPVENAGNTLRPGTAARLAFRLPPTLDAQAAGERIKTLLEADPPAGARVRFDLGHPHAGWQAPPLATWLAASLAAASQAFFGHEQLTMGCGGTIPFMKMLGDRFPTAQFLVTGVLGPHSNAHGPNEFLHIPTGKRITSCVAQVLADHARRPSAEG